MFLAKERVKILFLLVLKECVCSTQTWEKKSTEIHPTEFFNKVVSLGVSSQHRKFIAMAQTAHYTHYNLL
jgi:hypothetical protein